MAVELTFTFCSPHTGHVSTLFLDRLSFVHLEWGMCLLMLNMSKGLLSDGEVVCAHPRVDSSSSSSDEDDGYTGSDHAREQAHLGSLGM